MRVATRNAIESKGPWILPSKLLESSVRQVLDHLYPIHMHKVTFWRSGSPRKATYQSSTFLVYIIWRQKNGRHDISLHRSTSSTWANMAMENIVCMISITTILSDGTNWSLSQTDRRRRNHAFYGVLKGSSQFLIHRQIPESAFHLLEHNVVQNSTFPEAKLVSTQEYNIYSYYTLWFMVPCYIYVFTVSFIWCFTLFQGVAIL